MTDTPTESDSMYDAPGEVAYVDASLEALIPRYLERRRDDVASVESAVASEDWETVTTLGHTMKGSGGGYGFDTITAIGADIERAGRDHDAGVARDGAARLRRYLDTVTIEFVEE